MIREKLESERLEELTDFAPLFDLWLLHSRSSIDLSNKFIIKSFNAFVSEVESNTVFLGSQDLNVLAQLNVGIPFLKLKSDASAQWKKEKSLKQE